MLGTGAANAEQLCRMVGSDWVWFSDHIAMSVDYYVIARADREYQIGTGISINDNVLGSKRRGRGLTEVTAYGVGALHVRKADAGEDFEVCVGATRLEAIDLCGKKWMGYNDCPTF